MLLIGLAAGYLASRFMGAENASVLPMLVVGVVGSFVGPIVIRLLGFKTLGFPGSLIAATVGAALCIAAIRYFGPKF